MTMNNFTILSALDEGALILKRAWSGVFFHAPPHPKFDAQVLLAGILQQSSAYLFAHGNDALSPEIAHQFFIAIDRRAKHEPVAFILGTKAFFGRDFFVTHDTLIPRPETELLIETALPLVTSKTLIVDVGTGSGAIGITLALESKAPVIALDVSGRALETAQKNATHLNAHDRMSFLQGNLLIPLFPAFAQWPSQFPIDHLLVCANLPYLTENQWEALNPNVKNFEPKSALVGGYTGLELYDELLMQIKAKRNTLPEGITLLCEIDPAQKEKLPKIIRAHFSHAHVTVIDDLAHMARLVIATF